MTPSEILLRGHSRTEYRLGADWRKWRDIDTEPLAICKYRLSEPDERPVLFFGPWYGEFGWELTKWQGGVRKMALESNRRIVVMSFCGHEVLYEYADEFWLTPPLPSGITSQCMNVRSLHGDDSPKTYLLRLAKSLATEFESDIQIVPAQRLYPQKHIRLGKPEVRRPIFCYFPRTRMWQSHKNWPSEYWCELTEKISEYTGLTPVEITSSWKLSDSIQTLRQAHFSFCPESGAIFLSLLCGTTTLAFGREHFRKRVTKTENYLSTPIRYFGWKKNPPEPARLFNEFKPFLRTV